jgi:hypothetical protein
MKRRPFLEGEEEEESGSQDASVCKTNDPGKCPPVVMACTPGKISVTPPSSNLRMSHRSSLWHHSASSPEIYTGQPNSWAQVRWVV